MGRVKLELRDIWLSGIPLSEAWLSFARADDRRAYRALAAAPLRDPELDIQGAPPTIRVIERVGRELMRQGELSSARDPLKADALDRLIRSDLVALGYTADAEGIARLGVVDPDFIVTGDLRWNDDRIISGPIEFMNIMVVTREDFENARGAISPRGRPGKYQKIDQAIERALAANSNILDRPNKTIIPILQEILSEIDPDGISSDNGYSISSFNNRLSAARNRKQELS